MSQRRSRIAKAGGKGPVRTLASSSLIALALLSLLPLGIQASADGATDQPLLAVVGNIRITTDDLFREMQRRPGDFSTAERRQALLDRVVTDALAYEAAVKEGFDRHPDVVGAVRGLIAKRYTRNALETELAAASVADEEIEALL